MNANGIIYCRGLISERTDKLEARSDSSSPVDKPVQKPKTKKKAKGAGGDIALRMRQLERASAAPEFAQNLGRAGLPGKGDVGYGRPAEGTQAAERGRRANKHVHKEILELCEVIYCNGVNNDEDGTTAMLFGDLFKLYTRISDKVVGILMRAKKYELVFFVPEILFQVRMASYLPFKPTFLQGQDDEEPVFLTRPLKDIYEEFNQNAGAFPLPKEAPTT